MMMELWSSTRPSAVSTDASRICTQKIPGAIDAFLIACRYCDSRSPGRIPRNRIIHPVKVSLFRPPEPPASVAGGSGSSGRISAATRSRIASGTGAVTSGAGASWTVTSGTGVADAGRSRPSWRSAKITPPVMQRLLTTITRKA